MKGNSALERVKQAANRMGTNVGEPEIRGNFIYILIDGIWHRISLSDAQRLSPTEMVYRL